MAISVDYSTAPPWLITIPQSDLTLESGTKYKLTVDQFWLLLRDFTDNETTMARPVLYSRIPATSSTPSITEIDLTYYALQFEDGLYSVNIIEGNTNIREAEVKNQVSVNTNNTTGFIDPVFLQYSTYDGGVWIDAVGGTAGTTYPTGTPAQKVSNMPDALTIAAEQGFESFFIVGDVTIDSGLDYTDKQFFGQGQNLSHFTVSSAADVLNCTFAGATISGTLDGSSKLDECIIDGLNFVSGVIENCILNPSTITLGGSAIAQFIDCESGVPGTGTPTIDCGGSGQPLSIRGYSGGIKLTNKTGPEAVSIDLVSGQVKIDLTTVTNGTIVVRGVGKIINDADDSDLPSGVYGGMTLINETVSGLMVRNTHDVLTNIEGGLDADQILRILLAAVAGKGGDAGGGTFRYRDLADTKDRIVANVSGNDRTSVTLDGS